MPTSEATRKRVYAGPWLGINELAGEAGKSEWADAYNVELAGDDIVTRGGRRALPGLFSHTMGAAGYPRVMPAAVFRFGFVASATQRADYTREATDFDTTTVVNLDALGTNAGDRLWLGFTHPVDRLFVEVANANTNPRTLTVKYYKQTTGYGAVANLVDGTSSGGTLAITGQISWDLPTDWVPSTIPNGSGGANAPAFADQFQLYWL